jgi:ketosteroid isomerase-like protein
VDNKLSENERIADEFFKTLSAGNYPALRLMFRSDAVWTVIAKSIPGSGDHTGPKGIVDDFLMPVRGMFVDGDPKLRITNSFSKGAWVAVETQALGSLNNGKKYDNKYCWIIEIIDKKVKTVREYMDGGYVATLV